MYLSYMTVNIVETKGKIFEFQPATEPTQL